MCAIWQGDQLLNLRKPARFLEKGVPTVAKLVVLVLSRALSTCVGMGEARAQHGAARAALRHVDTLTTCSGRDEPEAHMHRKDKSRGAMEEEEEEERTGQLEPGSKEALLGSACDSHA